jgi:hypothetical protein
MTDGNIAAIRQMVEDQLVRDKARMRERNKGFARANAERQEHQMVDGFDETAQAQETTRLEPDLEKRMEEYTDKQINWLYQKLLLNIQEQGEREHSLRKDFYRLLKLAQDDIESLQVSVFNAQERMDPLLTFMSRVKRMGKALFAGLLFLAVVVLLRFAPLPIAGPLVACWTAVIAFAVLHLSD